MPLVNLPVHWWRRGAGLGKAGRCASSMRSKCSNVCQCDSALFRFCIAFFILCLHSASHVDLRLNEIDSGALSTKQITFLHLPLYVTFWAFVIWLLIGCIIHRSSIRANERPVRWRGWAMMSCYISCHTATFIDMQSVFWMISSSWVSIQNQATDPSFEMKVLHRPMSV